MTQQKDDWIQSALDSWLSYEPGKGPSDDDERREPSSPADQVTPDAPPMEASTGQAAQETIGQSLERTYEDDRATFRDAMTSFRQRLMYSFPSIQDMTVEDLALAEGWLAEMEKFVTVRSRYSFLHKLAKRPAYDEETRAALSELSQLKQAYARQRARIATRQQQEAARTNREQDAFVREQSEKRMRILRDTNEDLRRIQERTQEEQARLRDKNHREFLRYLRDEQVVLRTEVE
ncbi:MAG TPA: hypothetical protein VLE27_07435 [Thermoanaerobaculia bacterium]|nr:hypothetical protein [Thermoanaerobaculia bacterium]